MYQPFSHANNRGPQRNGQIQQQQPMNYQRVYAAQNSINQNQNQPSNSMLNQQVKPSKMVIPSQQQHQNSTIVPLSNQNSNRPSSAYYNGQHQQAPQRFSQYSQQQQKPQQYRIVNGSQYSQSSSSSLQQPYQQNQYYQQIPQNYQSIPNPSYSSKTSTMYSNASTPSSVQGDRRTLIQQVQQQKQQQHQQPVVQQQYYSNQGIQQVVQQQPQKVEQEFTVQRLFSSIQAFHVQLHNLTSSYQQTIHQKKMTIDEINKQKIHFRMEVENIYNSCKKLTIDYPSILCVVTRLSNGDAGIRRANGVNQTEKEINHMISLIEETFLQFVQIKQVSNQQTIIPVTIQKSQSSQNDIALKNASVRESTFSTRADIQLKKSTENLKTIIEESREKTLQDKENSNVYSPITRAYPRGREFGKNNDLFENEQYAHQYGSTHKERLNTSPDRIQNNDHFSKRVTSPPSEIVSISKNPFVQQQALKRQFTFNTAQDSAQKLKENGRELIKIKEYTTTQPDLPAYQPIFKDLYLQTEQEKVKRSAVSPSNIAYQAAPYTPMMVQPTRLSTNIQNNYAVDQFQQVKDFNQLLKDTKQFSLQTTNNDLIKLMDEQKYEQVSEYAYQTLTEIDRQIINMKATVEIALSQTEMTMTKNLLLEIIESLRATVKSKEIDISNRYVQKIQKNTARLLKDKTASYSLYLYLQKITNFLKERENILNTSIQANEMSLLNQTDHSFWNNNLLDNNDPNQIIPIIEKAKSNQYQVPSSNSTAFNFQFFLREELNIPSYVPMKEQQRMVEEVKQSIQGVPSLISNEPQTRFSVTPIQSSSTFQQFNSAQKPTLQNQIMTESYTSPQTSSNRKFGAIQPPEYVPYSSAAKSQRPQSAQSSTILGVRSSSVNPSVDIFKSNTAFTNLTSVVQDFQRTNKFQNEEELLKRATSIPAKIFSTTQEDCGLVTSPAIAMTPSSNKYVSEEFAHNRKTIKSQFTHSPATNTPNQSAPQTKQDSILQQIEFTSPIITPQVSERKLIQLQKINSGSNEQNKQESDLSNKNYSINHLITPGNKIITTGTGSQNAQFEIKINNNTNNLDSILNKYRVIDIERQIKQVQNTSSQINTPSKINGVNTVSNVEFSTNQDANFVSQAGEAKKKDEECVKKSALPIIKVNNTLEEIMNRENNPNLAFDVQKNPPRQVNLQYESIIEKYIPSCSDKNQKLGNSSRSALEQVNTQSNQNPSKNYSTQNILAQVNKPVQVVNNNDPLQSVQTKYDIVVNQQQESLQQASLNFNIQQMQKKFYDLALKLKGEYPKNHKANTITINQLWESGQNLSENEWQDYIVQEYNAAK